MSTEFRTCHIGFGHGYAIHENGETKANARLKTKNKKPSDWRLAMYQYDNGISNISQEILPKFKRFHNCNAQWHEFIFNGEEHGMTSHYDGRTYTLISYSTWITFCSWYHSGWVLYMNPNAYEYSATTSRQLNRFLREIGVPDSVIANLKKAIAQADSDLFECGSCLVSLMSSDTLSDMWHRIYE